MAKPSSRPLRPNPFHTYRDPETGKWKVVNSEGTEAPYGAQVDSIPSLELAPKVLCAINVKS